MTDETTNGLRWLEALADQYESTARAIRDTATLIRQAEHANMIRGAPRAQATETSPGDHSVQISEAIRQVLGGSMKPLKSGEIWDAIRASRIQLRTRSANPRSLLDSTLASMERSRQVRRTTDAGQRVKWVLTV